ncbi:MAG: OmpA family protein [Syntrophaceae bacterium]|nr:OmpA family protein [Syntrophaceae bacterium]
MARVIAIVLAVLLGILVLAGILLYPDYTKQKEALQACEKNLSDLEKKGQASAAQLKSAQETLVTSLNEQIKKQEVTIKELQGGFSLSMVDRILFKLGEATLTPQGEKVLAKVGEGLKQVQGKIIRVVGHTDTIPIRKDFLEKFPSNWELSAARASTVVRYFQDKSGLDPKGMEAVGRSYYQPAAPMDTEKNRALNRRVEILIAPTMELKEK